MISKILLFSLLICYSFSSLQAQFSTPKTLSQCVDCSPYEVKAVDIDGRNGIDFIAISKSSIVLYLNNGQRQFELQEIYTDSKHQFHTLEATDVDGDDILDISVFKSKGYKGKSQLVWFKHDGNGNFSPLKIGIQEVNMDYESAYADIDGDGDLDVFGQTYWHINIGEGKFEKKLGDLVSQREGRISKIVDMSTYHTRVLMDIDNDQDLDLLLVDREIENKKHFMKRFIQVLVLDGMKMTMDNFPSIGKFP